MFKSSETELLISVLEDCRSNLKKTQEDFKKNLSSKLPDEEKRTILDDRVSRCTDAYYQYMDHLEIVCEVYLSKKHEKDDYFKCCVEGDVMTSKLNHIIKKKYPKIWEVKCELLGDLDACATDPETMAKIIKDAFSNPVPLPPTNKTLDTGMSPNQFYAEFGTRMLYVVGIELEKFYKHTVHVLKMGKGWDAKDKREIRYMIDVFKSCKGHDKYMDDSEYKRWKKKVDRAIGLYQKHWLGLWN